jgi:DNA invertase Pin-like site-specific DNA recombinase
MGVQKMRAVIYTRTSTKQQRTDMQLDALHALVKNSNYELVDVIEDVGISGGKKGRSRAGMAQLMEMVNRREVDVVCVYSVDRIGRSMGDIISLVEELDQKGVGLIIHKNAIDTSTAQGKILVGFFALVAQMEKDMNNSRVRDGVAAARAKGKQIGRKPLSATKLNEIREMRRQGKGMNFIAKHLSVGNSQVLRVCREMAEAA